MEIREYLLAAVVVVPALGLPLDTGRAQEAQLPDTQAPASPVVPSAGTGAQQNSGVDTQSTAAGKAVPAESAKEGTWSAPIDTRVTVHQGRTPNKVTKSIGAVTTAIQEHLLGKSSKRATIAGMAGHTHAHDQRLNPSGSPVGKSSGAVANAPARNAIGATVDHHVTADRDVPASRSALQNPATQAAAAFASGMPVSATASGLAAPNQSHQPQVNRLDPSAHGPIMLSAGGPAINGTAMIRPGSSTGAVGGSAKVMAGVISGSNVRMKRF
jgi:hypothetical protein